MAGSAQSTLPPATYNTTNILGVDVTAQPTTPSSLASQTQLYYPENSSPNFAPGQIVLAGGSEEFVFCQVGTVGSINQFDAVAFVPSVSSTFTVVQLSSVQANLGCRVGFNQGAGLPVTTSTTVQWCWIATRGSNLKANFYASTPVNLTPYTITTGSAIHDGNLFISTIPGVLGTASASTFLLAGLTNTASTGAGTGSIASAAIIATWPRVFLY